MRALLRPGLLVLSLLFIPLISSTAMAQATRTWVSGVGDDANPCSRTAPCKTFAGAISKTAAQGIISVLDPGGFGAVTITKSITIEGGTSTAGILAAGSNGVIINAAATDRVILRDLYLEGFNTGLNGIRILAAGSVLLDDVRIERFTQNGVDIAATTAVDVSIRAGNIVGLNGSGAGINVQPAATGNANVDVEGTRIDSAPIGILAGPRSRVHARNVSVGAITGSAFEANSGATAADAAEILVSDSSAMESGVGVEATGAHGKIVLHDSTVANNGIGILSATGGIVQTFGDNRIYGNATNGQPSAELGKQ